MTTENKPHPRQQIVDNFLSTLRNGDSAFTYPFEAGEIAVPINGSTGKTYAGANRLILSDRNENDPRWMTEKQAGSLGYQAAKKVDAKLVVPEFSEMERQAGLGTFNDLHKIAGLDAVAKAVNQVRQQAQTKNTEPSR